MGTQCLLRINIILNFFLNLSFTNGYTQYLLRIYFLIILYTQYLLRIKYNFCYNFVLLQVHSVY